MITLDQQINKLEDISGITPRLAYLLKLQFLEIESQADNDEIDVWLDASEGNEDLFFDVIKILREFDSKYPLEQRIKDLAVYGNITSRSIELLLYSSVRVFTEEESNEIVDWMHECAANDRVFDVVLELDMKKGKTATIHFLQELLMTTSPNDPEIRQLIFDRFNTRLVQSKVEAVQASPNPFSNS